MALLFERFAHDREFYGINAQPGICVRGIEFEIVDRQTELPCGGDEVLQTVAGLQLEVDLEMVGLVFDVGFHFGEAQKPDHQRGKTDERGCVQTEAEQRGDDGHRPHTHRSGKPHDLVLGREDDRVGSRHRDADKHRRRQEGESDVQHGDKVDVGNAREHRSDGQHDKGAQARGVAVSGAFAAQDDRHKNDEHGLERGRSDIDFQ